MSMRKIGVVTCASLAAFAMGACEVEEDPSVWDTGYSVMADPADPLSADPLMDEPEQIYRGNLLKLFECKSFALRSPSERQQFCQTLSDLAQRARCWEKLFVGPTEWNNWCHYEWG